MLLRLRNASVLRRLTQRWLDTTPSPTPVPLKWRSALAVLFGGVAGRVAFMTALGNRHPRDIAQVWFAARALVSGQDPYALIGPGRTFEWPAPFFYPLPAAIVALPLAPWSEHVAVGLFAAVGAGVFAWALMARGSWPLVAFASVSVWHAVVTAQWSPLLAGAIAIAPLGAVLVAKPTIGAAVWFARPTWWASLGGAVLLLIAFVIQPQWLIAWHTALKGTSVVGNGAFPYLAPVLRPGGELVLLTLLRWRRWDARLVMALACVPQTLLPYEGVLLFLIPRRAVECIGFVALNIAMGWWFLHQTIGGSLGARMPAYGTAMVWCLYLPATAIILRRPNEA